MVIKSKPLTKFVQIMFLESFIDNSHLLIIRLQVNLLRAIRLLPTTSQLLFDNDALLRLVLIRGFLLKRILHQLFMVNTIIQLAIIIEFVLSVRFTAAASEDQP